MSEIEHNQIPVLMTRNQLAQELEVPIHQIYTANLPRPDAVDYMRRPLFSPSRLAELSHALQRPACT